MPQWLLPILTTGMDILMDMDPVSHSTQLVHLTPKEAHKVSAKGPLKPNLITDTANTPGLQLTVMVTPPLASDAVENDLLNPPATNMPTPELEASPKSVLLTFSPTSSDP